MNQLNMESTVTLLLQEVQSEDFVPSVKFETLVLTVCSKVVAQFLSKNPTQKSAVCVKHLLQVMNEVTRKDAKFLEIILRDSFSNFVENLAVLFESPWICAELFNELSTLFLGLTVLSLETGKSFQCLGNIHYKIIGGIVKLSPRIKLDCLNLLRKLCEVPGVHDSLQQTENFDRMLDWVLQVVSSCDAAQTDLAVESLSFLIFLCHERSNLVKRCALKGFENILLKNARLLENLQVQQFLHTVSASANQPKCTTRHREISKPDKSFLLSITELKCYQGKGHRPEISKKRPFTLSRGSFLPTASFSHLVFLDVNKIENLSEDSISRAVCALLNAGNGGIIYSGIKSNGLIQGLEISREKRDSFRCALDRLLRADLDPPLCTSFINLQFIPVYNSEKALRDESESLLVIAIRVPADMGELYTWRKGNKTLLLTGPNRIEELDIKGIRRWATEIMKKEFQPTLRQLERELQSLQDNKKSIEE